MDTRLDETKRLRSIVPRIIDGHDFSESFGIPQIGDNMDGKGLRHVAFSMQFAENYHRFKERQHRA